MPLLYCINGNIYVVVLLLLFMLLLKYQNEYAVFFAAKLALD